MNFRRAGLTAVAVALLVGATSLPARAAEDPSWTDIRTDYREGDFRAAQTRLERLVVVHPQDREAHYYLALVHWRLENYPAAAASWRRVLELDPNGPFGKDAQNWLMTYADLAVVNPNRPTPRPVATPFEVFPSVRPTARPTALPTPAFPATPAPVVNLPPSPLPLATLTPKPRATTTPPPRTPWLTAQAPQGNGGRMRSRNAKPGFFKALDGTFEFVPPVGFVLLDEGVDGSERRALFGPVQTIQPGGAEQPPTLLIVWRDMAELARLTPGQRAARERQLLTIEAATYGPGARLEARFGVPTMRVTQRQGGWAADTWLFFQHGRLYALTYGGDAAELPRYAPAVSKSLATPIFYP